MIPLIFILSCLSGWLYRRGGTDKGTLWRDLGVSLVTFVTIMLLILANHLKLTSGYWLSSLLSFGLSLGALTTYWSFGNPDKKWYNWTAHSLGISLAMLPIVWHFSLWTGFVYRTIALCVLMTVWSEVTDWDYAEEFGRGFLIIATLPLLYL